MTTWSNIHDALSVTFRPIADWPRSANINDLESPFSASLKDTLSILKRELTALNAQGIVIEIDFNERFFRLDGLPRADARPQSPRVRISFKSKHGYMRLLFGRFPRADHNLRAIAMHLEHLRMASLYGVGSDGEQYKGWIALEAPDTTNEDIAILAEASGLTTRCVMTEYAFLGQRFNAVVRKARARAHPDGGGTHELFLAVTAAAERLCAKAQVGK